MRLLKTVAAIAAASSIATFSSADDVVVKFAGWRKQEIPMWEKINAEGLIPGVRVEYVLIDPEDYNARLQVSLQQNSVDIFTNKAGAAQLEPFIKSGAIKPLSGVNLDAVNPGTFVAVKGSDGEIYGVPFAVQLQSLQFDQAVFDEYGFEVPSNLAEFEALLAAAADEGLTPLAFAGGTGWFNNQVLNEVVLAGLLKDSDHAALVAGTQCFTDAPFVNALTKFMSWKPYFNEKAEAANYQEPRVPFALGEALFKIDGAWTTASVGAEYQANPSIEWGFMAIPGDNGKVVAWADGGYVGTTGTSNPEAVQKVLQFTATPAFGQLMVDLVGDVPAVVGDITTSDATVQAKIDALANAGSVVGFGEYALNKSEPTYGTLSANAYKEMVGGKITPAEAAKQIQDGLNSWGYVGAANCK